MPFNGPDIPFGAMVEYHLISAKDQSGSHTFVPISWMCKKQTSVSHSSTESETISLDAGLRRMGFQLLIFGIRLLKCFILHLTN